MDNHKIRLVVKDWRVTGSGEHQLPLGLRQTPKATLKQNNSNKTVDGPFTNRERWNDFCVGYILVYSNTNMI